MSENTTETPTKLSRIAFPNYAALIVVPLLLFGVIVAFAPNFVPTGELRQHPLGGDFLQEYAGGALFRDQQQNNQLYNIDVCREFQHNEMLLRFKWDESNFFPMVYPPFYYAAVSPLSRLEYLTAARAWLLLMTVFLIGGLLILKRNLQIHTGWLLLVCVTAPMLLSLTTGQKSSFLFLILTATWALYRAEKPFTAGAVFGLIAFKPHLGIPIGLFMLARKQWSFVLGCYFTVGWLIVASFITGFDICTDYIDVTMGFSNYLNNSGYHLEQGFSLWSAWQLAIGDDMIAKVATIMCSIVVLGGTAWFVRQPGCWQGDNLSRSFSAMTIATLLVAPHLYAYDLAMLVLPAILLADIAIRNPENRMELAPVIALAVVLFGMSALIAFGSVSGLNLGVLLLVAVWAWTLKSVQEQGPASDSVTVGVPASQTS